MMAISLIFLMACVFPAAAEVGMPLNFAPASSTTSTICDIPQADCTLPGGYFPGGGGVNAGNDGTRFIQEKVFRNNKYYFHVIVGAPSQGFGIEYYVEANNPIAAYVNFQVVGTRPNSLNSGGNERLTIGNKDVLDVGNQSAMNRVRMFGNAKDPFGVSVDTSTGSQPYDLTGNGSEDPRKVLMRMALSDANISLDVVKPLLDRKPRISQTTTDNAMTAQFVADMRGITYDEMNRAAPLTNRLALNDPSLPQQGAADFDMSQAQRSNVTAGRFIYTPGQGWLSPLVDFNTGEYVLDNNGNFIWVANPYGWDVDYSRFDEGSYTYADGEGFNVFGLNWASFFDFNQNRAACNSRDRSARGICPQ